MRFKGAAWGPAVGALLLACMSAQARAAGGAYAVDDAAIGKPGECQVESWVSHASNSDFIGVVQPACVVKIGLPVEFTAAFLRVRFDHAWSDIAGLQGKVVPINSGNVAVALVIGTSFDLTIGESAFSFVNVPVTVKVHDRFRVNVNAGWLLDAVLDHHHFTWGAGFEWDFAKSMTAIAEVYGQTEHLTEPRVQAGLRYKPAQNMDLDVIYGHNIVGEGAHWLTAGVTMRF